MVSGLMQSDGEGERSRLVTGGGRPSAGPKAAPPRCAPPRPSPDMPFSDRNSSRSAYCNRSGRQAAPGTRAPSTSSTRARGHKIRVEHIRLARHRLNKS